MREKQGAMGENPGERAEQWLKSLQMPENPLPSFLDRPNISNGQEGFVSRGLQVQRIDRGRFSCTFKVPHRLADKSGAWHLGTIPTLIDVVGAAAIISWDRCIKVSVDFNISYFSPAKVNDEIEIDARVVGHNGGLSMVCVDLRNKATGELVAQGRQSMHIPSIVARTVIPKL